MAEYQQQNGPQYFRNAAESQEQWNNLYSTAGNSIPNNLQQIEIIREDARKIYIGKLDKETTEKDLWDHFVKFGDIQYIDIKLEATTGLCRGFAFVVYRSLNGLVNALACTNHVINRKTIEPKRAIPRRVKLFVGGLSPNLTDTDIQTYFRHFAYIVRAEMPYDYVRNQRRSFCFLTFDNIHAVTTILRCPKHVIKGIEVEVKVAALNAHDYRMMLDTSRSMAGKQGNVMAQRDFLPQSGYAPYAPGCFHEGYAYYIPYLEYSPNYSSGYGSPSYGHPSYGYPSYGHPSYGYPCYVAGATANYEYRGNGAPGAPGESGASRASEAPGVSGASGASGANGASEASGAPGASGSSGENEASGTSRASEASGSSEASKANEAFGKSRASEASGVSEASGASGASEANLASGASGTSRASEASGASGASALSGVNGN